MRSSFGNAPPRPPVPGLPSSRSARSFSKSIAMAGSGLILPILCPSSPTSARAAGSARTRRPNARAAGLMS